MSNNSIRIRTTPDGKDKYVKVKLEQDFDFIEILSLKISQAETYRNFCADYGVVVGRVFINNGFGVPNARVSIFIPIDDVDRDDPIIKGLYPYEVVTDKDIDGKRYNVLPKSSETDNDCYTPVGTFPNKREALDDPEMGYVYCKYYKFTTTTNYAGDYMIFGVPIGNYTVHVDADISDIGIASQRPYDSISQGSPIQMFDSPTKFKGGTNLDRLIQIKTTNAGVNVQPFWGSVENCEIGISRIDLDLNYEIKPSAIFMGGAFGDTAKNSVNKNCRPRRKMGKMCEQNTGEGTIQMIRKTLDGKIEKLDIEGGRLIDDKGAWAYQIPMNLDYQYTNEFGQLVLSEDPNKGIPTKASVRFKIGIDGAGGLGRLRTRANYLIPHNPDNVGDIDYEFGELTKDVSFRDLHWNKIYSVSNFISRYQRAWSISTVKNRNFVGLKDVDYCAGDKLPPPFNRVNTQFNPLFFIICLIMRIIEFNLFVINSVVVTIVNTLLFPWNALVGLLCEASRRRLPRPLRFVRPFGFLSGACNWKVPYMQCIFVKCPFDEPKVYYFAPGCIRTNGIPGSGFRELVNSGINAALIKNEIPDLSNCVAASMAASLDLFQFDFYNDWLNGSLYYFLVKYKRRGRSDKFCNYDCSSNRCRSSILVDTCYNSEENFHSTGIYEGMIKKYNNELYYAPLSKNGLNKLYATEVINLGAVFNCDWQGVPKIHELLVPSTYLIPPIIDDYLDENPSITETTGQIDIGAGFGGLFFSISCLGLTSNQRQTLNMRHACEFGVDLDEVDELDNGTILEPNGWFGPNEINSEYGKYVRDTFFGLNNVPNSLNVSFPYTTDFNTNSLPNGSGVYNFASPADNGANYTTFRGYLNNNSFSQPKHSFYFYFGVVPGAGGLEKMNANFFTTCFQELALEFFIRIDDTTAISETGASDGGVKFTIISGVGPFNYVVTGPNGYNTSGTLGTLTPPDLTQILTGLEEGSYTISVTDSSNIIITQTFDVAPPTPLYAAAIVSSGSTALAPPYNGSITITTIGGGNGTYEAALYNSSGTLVPFITCPNGVNSANGNPADITQVPTTFCGLPPDIAPNANNTFSFDRSGYYIVFSDASTPPQTFSGFNLTLNGVLGLTTSIQTTGTTCYNTSNGIIKVNVAGGNEPYTITTYDSNDLTDALFTSANYNTASIGTYVTKVTDSSSPQQTFQSQPYQIVSAEPEMKLQPNILTLPVQCDPTKYVIDLRVINGGVGVNQQSLLPIPQNYTTKYPAGAWIQFNYNEAEDANSNLIWTAVQLYPYLNSNYDIKVEIPANLVIASVKVRLSNPAGTCGSNFADDETDFDRFDMELPPCPLTVDTIGIDNSKQCTPEKISFKFNISHLLLATYRRPYTLEYQIANSSGVYGAVTTYQNLITQNQQLITLIVPKVLVGTILVPSSSAKVKFRVKDNVGCYSPWEEIKNNNGGPIITIPTAQLNVGWTINQLAVPPSPPPPATPLAIKTYVIGGGIAPYTTPAGQPLLSTNNNTTASATVSLNNGLYITVVDSVGCTITANSN
jgi:hypothetical protein